ncbi:hypothetical protein V6N12_054520 [Hibiscus sabdariffa]|uniref:Uncharacterized protein n=1 Tax=Hibiscus sabdariffa TaxID=183260 RepID=A0ABR2D0P2_9ROSI
MQFRGQATHAPQVTSQETYDEFDKHRENSWKDINDEFLKLTEMPVAVPNRSLTRNLARAMEVLYREGDDHTHVGKATKASYYARNSLSNILS